LVELAIHVHGGSWAAGVLARHVEAESERRFRETMRRMRAEVEELRRQEE
jgi:hypothetical protein